MDNKSIVITGKLSLVLVVLLLVVGAALAVLVTSCSTFRPIGDVSTMEPECVYSLNVMRVRAKSDDKSGIVPSEESCLKCMKKVRCQREVFGVDKSGRLNPVDYDDFARFKRYSACKGEL